MVERLAALGDREMRASAALGSRMLARPATAISSLSGGEGSVGGLLDELRDLARSLQRDMPVLSSSPRRRFLGLLPASDPLEALARHSARAEQKIDAVVRSLQQAQQVLRSENAAIAQDLAAVRTQSDALRRHAYMAAGIDAALPTRELSTDLLLAVRQRRRDLLTQIAITTQGEAALRVVEENNAELIRAIEGATSTTTAALRTSAVAVQALLAGRMIRARLKDAGSARAASAPGAYASAQEMKRAWAAVDATLDQVHTFRAQALVALKETAVTLAAGDERRAPAR
ncbi:MAG: toxic anion resistance protein [Candidatus Dormibacteria bacterium]